MKLTKEYVRAMEVAWRKAIRLGALSDHAVWSREYNAYMIGFKLGYLAALRTPAKRKAKPAFAELLMNPPKRCKSVREMAVEIRKVNRDWKKRRKAQPKGKR